jgi:hypothetical protein
MKRKGLESLVAYVKFLLHTKESSGMDYYIFDPSMRGVVLRG